MSGERVTGKVKWFNMKRGFGFIETEGNGDLFVHHTQIRAEGFKALNEGAEVELTLSTGDKGPQADDVKQLTEFQKSTYSGRKRKNKNGDEDGEDGEDGEAKSDKKGAKKEDKSKKDKKDKDRKEKVRKQKAENSQSASEWIQEVLGAIDSNSSEKVGEHLQDSSSLKIGDGDEVTGKEDFLKALFAHYWPEKDTPKEVKHEVAKVWSVRGAVIVEVTVQTVAADGASSSKSSCMVFPQKKMKVEKCRIY